MATTKITVTVPEELVAYIRAQVADGRFDSVSAYVTAAATSFRALDPLQLLIDSMIAETGEPDAAAEAWADEVVAVAKRASRAARDADSRSDDAGSDDARGHDAA